MADLVQQENEMNEFYFKAKDRFLELCLEYNVSVPLITPAVSTDPCDFTDVDQVRLNVEKMEGLDDPDTFEYYVNHVFIHYLCELNNSKESDYVVDLILSWKNKNE